LRFKSSRESWLKKLTMDYELLAKMRNYILLQAILDWLLRIFSTDFFR